MKNTFLFLGLLALLITRSLRFPCSSYAIFPTKYSNHSQQHPTTTSTIQVTPSATIAPTQTQSPPATPIPSPTATPPPGISKDNFSEFAVTTQYLPGLRKAVKDLKDDFVFNGLDISPNGRYIAVGGCTQGFAFSCPNDVFGSRCFPGHPLDDPITAELVSILPEKERPSRVCNSPLIAASWCMPPIRRGS